MNGHRSDILDWVQQGKIDASAIERVLQVTGFTPGRAEWRDFIDRVALWLGAIFCAVSVIFFFAYNWEAMGRYAKFGLVEVLLLAAVAVSWRLGLDRLSGKAALLAAALLVGSLLALVGQTYQTGADTFELFAVWALAILPWVAVARFGALWLFWVGLLNLAVYFYFSILDGLFGFLIGAAFGPQHYLWALFVLNTVALAVWEAASLRFEWLRERWPVRILATAAGVPVTVLAVWAVLDARSVGGGALLAYLAWMVAAYFVYRRWRPDLYVLAAGVLSVVILVAVLLSKQLLTHDAGGAFLFIGMLVIGLSAAGGWWLKTVAAELRT